jgi:hypothetical protein
MKPLIILIIGLPAVGCGILTLEEKKVCGTYE